MGEFLVGGWMPKTFKCIYEGCSATFDRQGKLDQHILDHSGARPFPCPEEGCDKTFTRKTHVKRHLLTHSQEKPFACTEPGCDQRYYTSQHLNRHLETQKRPKPHACTFPDCKESFAKRNQLQRHMCVHTGRKPYPCNFVDPETSTICTAEFDYPSQLKRHKDTHKEKEKNFFCGEPNCGKMFATRKQLTPHMERSHANSNWQQCTECEKKFKDPSKLKAHMATHEYNEYACTYGNPICGRVLFSKNALDQHIKICHERSTEAQCPLCGNVFTTKYSLQRHQQKCTATPGSQEEISTPAPIEQTIPPPPEALLASVVPPAVEEEEDDDFRIFAIPSQNFEKRRDSPTSLPEPPRKKAKHDNDPENCRTQNSATPFGTTPAASSLIDKLC